MSWLRKFHTPLSSNALIKLSSEIVGRIATFALALYIARALGETTFGLFNYGLALAFVLSQLADLGLQLLMTREVAIHGHQAQRAVATAFRVKLWLSLLVVLLLLWLTASRPGSVRLSFISLGLALLAQTYLEFAVYIFRGQQRLLAEAALLTIARLLTALLAGLVVWRGGSLPGITLSYLAATLLMAGWAVWLIGREGWLRAPAGVSLIRLPLAGPLVRQALPLGIAVFLSISYTRLAIFMLENQLGESAVASYSAAQRLVEPTQIIPAALLAAVFPALSGALHHDRPRALRLGIHSSLLLALLGSGLALSFWFGAPWIISLLYGSSYVAAVPVLQYLGLSVLPAYVNYSLTHILLARGQQALTSLFVALMLLLHFSISWQLIPSRGPAGTAISVTLAELVLFACCALTLLLTRPGQPQPSPAARP